MNADERERAMDRLGEIALAIDLEECDRCEHEAAIGAIVNRIADLRAEAKRVLRTFPEVRYWPQGKRLEVAAGDSPGRAGGQRLETPRIIANHPTTIVP